MPDKEQTMLQPMQEISIEEFLNQSDLESPRRETFLVNIQDIILAENVRPFDYAFVDILAENIKEHGQLQECIGDVVVEEDGNWKVRILAGQHRSLAIRKINSEGIPFPIRISVANRTLPPESIIEIQMSENLQNKMTSAQDAVVIHNFWVRYKDIRAMEGRSMTKVELARKVGRSPDTVANAIKYVEDLNPHVQKLVDERILPYSHALLLTEIAKGEGYSSQQLNLAQFFLAKSYNLKQARKHIQQLKVEGGFAGPLFGGEWEEFKINSYIIAIRDQSAKEGRAAAGWFVKMVFTARALGDAPQVKFTEAIQKAVTELGMSLEDFKKNLEPLVSQEEYAELFGEERV